MAIKQAFLYRLNTLYSFRLSLNTHPTCRQQLVCMVLHKFDHYYYYVMCRDLEGEMIGIHRSRLPMTRHCCRQARRDFVLTSALAWTASSRSTRNITRPLAIMQQTPQRDWLRIHSRRCRHLPGSTAPERISRPFSDHLPVPSLLSLDTGSRPHRTQPTVIRIRRPVCGTTSSNQ